MKIQLGKLLAMTLVLLFCLHLLGCGGGGGVIKGNPSLPSSGMIYVWLDGLIAPWYMPVPPETGISPLPGVYTFTPKETNGLNYSNIEVIIEEGSGKKYVSFASDSYRFDKIEIINGSFHYEWGLGIGSWPTDAYAISGTFTSKSRAEGLYKYAGANKTVQRQTVFIAQLP